MRILYLLLAILVGFIVWRLFLGLLLWLGHIFFVALEIALLIWLIAEVYKLLTNKNKQIL